MAHTASYEELVETENQRYHTFINIAMALAVITGIEIVIIFLPFSFAVIMTSLIVLSVIKFIAVILWFMHLIYDKILCFYLFLAGMIIATGTLVALLALMDREDVDMEVYGLDTAHAVVVNVAES